jgi:Bacterial TSP3 repeat
MTDTAFRDVLARVAVEPDFADHVKQNPGELTRVYGLTEDEAAKVLAAKVNTAVGRPARLEERLSRSGLVFGTDVTAAVADAPTEVTAVESEPLSHHQVTAAALAPPDVQAEPEPEPPPAPEPAPAPPPIPEAVTAKAATAEAVQPSVELDAELEPDPVPRLDGPTPNLDGPAPRLDTQAADTPVRVVAPDAVDPEPRTPDVDLAERADHDVRHVVPDPYEDLHNKPPGPGEEPVTSETHTDADGNTVTKSTYADGRQGETTTHPDGTVVEVVRTPQVQTALGTVGGTETTTTHHPDGRVTVTQGKTTTTFYPDGSAEETRVTTETKPAPFGMGFDLTVTTTEHVEINADGTRTVTTSHGDDPDTERVEYDRWGNVTETVSIDYHDDGSATETTTYPNGEQTHRHILSSQRAVDAVDSRVDEVALNPQPLPPKTISDATEAGIIIVGGQEAVPPHPITPSIENLNAKVDAVALNPQPLPPKEIPAANLQPPEPDGGFGGVIGAGDSVVGMADEDAGRGPGDVLAEGLGEAGEAYFDMVTDPVGTWTSAAEGAAEAAETYVETIASAPEAVGELGEDALDTAIGFGEDFLGLGDDDPPQPDPRTMDSDGDGLNDYHEAQELNTNPESSDSDGDRLLDAAETEVGTDPTRADTDMDGAADLHELVRGTDPLRWDTDGDQLSDGHEERLGTDPESTDSDGDGSSDGDEVQRFTDPNNADSDRDGLDDGLEQRIGSDPNDASSGWNTAMARDGAELAAPADATPLVAGQPAGMHQAKITAADLGATQLEFASGDQGADRTVDYGGYTGPSDGQQPPLQPAEPAGGGEGTDGARPQGLGEVLATPFLEGERFINDVFGDDDEPPPPPDPRTTDADSDGLTDHQERHETRTNPHDRDSDDDHWSDGSEVAMGLNPNSADTDMDGLSDWQERNVGIFSYSEPSNPLDWDTDDDGLSDGAEARQGTDPRNPDSDGDDLTDGFEAERYLDPTDADSDDDEYTDGEEIRQGTSPHVPDPGRTTVEYGGYNGPSDPGPVVK